ncbi:MAG: DEAD/DEAH box helicase, partial [Pygmaiobacter massiliensis]
FYGRVGGALARREMVSPTYVPADGSLPMTPVYHLTEGVNSKYIAKLVGTALTGCGAITDPLPEVLRQKYRLPDLRRTLEMIHTPKNEDEVTAARRRLVFEELYYLQLGMKLMRSINLRANRAVMANTDLTAFYNALPFTPTGAQQRAITEIASDLCGKTPMNRLLQGDVGSGKTLVAAAAMVIAAQNGFQSVLMAPTEILAQQHANTLQSMLRPLGIEVALLTGSVRAKPRRVLLEAISTGAAQVVVGTHAVLSDDVIFHRLGFAVTDEQHRFGVRQRGLLAAKAESPHLLVMSATPIPRTLSLLLFGELDVSILDELPPGRTPSKLMLSLPRCAAACSAFWKNRLKRDDRCLSSARLSTKATEILRQHMRCRQLRLILKRSQSSFCRTDALD